MYMADHTKQKKSVTLLTALAIMLFFIDDVYEVFQLMIQIALSNE